MRVITKIAAVLLLGTLTFAAWADDDNSDKNPPLNQVLLNLSAEKWSTTETARVIVNVNAVLKSDALNTFRTDLLKNLTKISDADSWHITQFYRYQDQSALDRLQVTAEARLPDTALSKLYDNAKAISKPGEQYTIGDIQFEPSLAEIEKTKDDARAQIYADANAELVRLNKEFPDSHFVIHTIDFLGVAVTPVFGRAPAPMGATMMMKDSSNGGGIGGAASGVSVSDKVTMMATVVYASILK